MKGLESLGVQLKPLRFNEFLLKQESSQPAVVAKSAVGATP